MASTTTDPDTSTVRHIRVKRNLWIRACQRAAQDGFKISEVIHVLLHRYANGDIDI